MKNTELNKNKKEGLAEFKKFVFLAMSHWFVFVLCIILFTSIAYLINRYSVNIYEIEASILIKAPAESGGNAAELI